MSISKSQVAGDKAKPVYPRIGLFIDGQWIFDRESAIEVINPSDETVLAKVPKATAEDLQCALSAAARGFLAWRDTPPKERVRIIQKATALMRERLDFIAQTITLENGKLFAHARAEADRSLNFFEWNAAQSLRDYGLIV